MEIEDYVGDFLDDLIFLDEEGLLKVDDSFNLCLTTIADVDQSDRE